jgi:hypothetical protein
MNFFSKPVFAIGYLPLAYLVAIAIAAYSTFGHFVEVFMYTVKHAHRVYGRMMRKPIPKTDEQDDFWNFS